MATRRLQECGGNVETHYVSDLDFFNGPITPPAEIPRQAPDRRRRVLLVAGFAAAVIVLCGGYVLLSPGPRDDRPVVLPDTLAAQPMAEVQFAESGWRASMEELFGDHPFDGRAFARNFMLMVAGECRGDIDEAARLSGRTATAAGFEPTTWALGLLGRTLSAADFVTATRALQSDARRIGQFFTEWDVLLTPTVASPPPLVGSLQPSARDRAVLTLLGRLNAGRLLDMMGMLDEAAGTAFAFTPWTPVFNLTGQPAMSVPLEWNSEGLPIGLHFVGRFGEEGTLFRLAGQLEQARPWSSRRPPVS